MMKKCNEFGRSMVEMLGVLAIIGVLTVAALSGYQKAMAKLNMNKIVSATVDVLRDWAELNMTGKVPTQPFDSDVSSGPFAATSYVYKEGCKEGPSTVVSETQICQLPIGELFIKKGQGQRVNSFMLFVSLLDNDPATCREFLAQDWLSMVPNRMKNGFMIWVASDKGSSQTVYAAGSTTKPTMATISNACQNACPDDSSYCTIVFDVATPKRVLQ